MIPVLPHSHIPSYGVDCAVRYDGEAALDTPRSTDASGLPGPRAPHQVVLVLAHANDAGAASVAASVRNLLALAPRRTEVWSVRPEALSLAAWSHTVDAQGRTHTRLALAGRPVLDSSHIRAVFNRIQRMPTPQFTYASAQECDRAAREFQGLMLSWLAACGDRAVPASYSSAVTPALSQALAPPLLQWATAAARCGLPVAARDADAPARQWNATVLVAGNHTTGILAGRLGIACMATAQTLGYAVLEFRFDRRADGVELVDVTAHPELTDLEDIDAVAKCIAALVPATVHA